MAHCKTCTCEPKTGWHLTVYPPNEILYGRCEICGDVRHATQLHSLRWRSTSSAMHCGCCTHPHDLEPGGHFITEKKRHNTAPLPVRSGSAERIPV